MGYFSNGTEGAIYETEHCEQCLHYNDDGCAVWLIHLLYNYDQESNEELKHTLSLLIPRGDDGFNEQCTMFHKRREA